MSVDRTPLPPEQVLDALAELPGWRPLPGALRAAFRCSSARAALDLVAAIGDAAEELDHHPDVDWRYDTVFVATTTHSAGGRTSPADVELARRVSALAADATEVPERSRTVEIAVDTEDAAAIRPVWAAALGYTETASGSLVDPDGRGPAVWFQETATPAAGRLHVDVRWDSSRAGEVVAAAGALAASVQAPVASFTIVTDAQGNRVCVCTPDGREDPTAP